MKIEKKILFPLFRMKKGKIKRFEREG